MEFNDKTYKRYKRRLKQRYSPKGRIKYDIIQKELERDSRLMNNYKYKKKKKNKK